jgi:hypothetical protein
VQCRYLGDHSFAIPKKTILLNSDFFDFRPDLSDNPSDGIESQVDIEDCEIFLSFLRKQDGSLVTSENRRSRQALADELIAGRLLEVCTELEAAEMRDNLIGRFLSLSDLISQQEDVIESVGRDFPPILCEFVVGQLASVCGELGALRKETDDRVLALSEEVKALRKETDDQFSGISATLELMFMQKVECRMTKAEPVDPS